MFNFSNIVTYSTAQFLVSSIMQMADGTLVTLRPTRPTDVPALLEMYERLSSDSIYYRYLHPYKPAVEELDCLARLDRAMGAAFVAIVDEERKAKVIGLGYYQTEPENQTAAQPAFLIEDEYQNQRVGRALARLVIGHARTNGIQVLEALIHPANRRMMYLVEKSGLPFQVKLSYGAYKVRIVL